MIITPIRLANVPTDKKATLDLISEWENEDKTKKQYTVKIKFVAEIHPQDFQYMQVYNIVKNKANEGLELTQLGRNFFDSKAGIELPAFSLEIWPGIQNSIRQGENEILLTVDIVSKVLRTDTVSSKFSTFSSNFVIITFSIRFRSWIR